MIVFKQVFFLLIIITFTACSRIDKPALILLFNGTGASSNDVKAIIAILDHEHLDYATVSSSELNGMNRSQIMTYRLLIMPGGDFIAMGKSLTIATSANIRYAVQHGLNYHGICAGAFLAGSSKYYNSFNLASGITFGFYSAENKGIRKASVAISRPGAPTLDQYWEDGPQLSGWGTVVAKYPDNTPAVAEGKCGKGFVILTGIHAEAPDYWRGDIDFHTLAEVDNAYAALLVKAALNGTFLPHF
ncbi:hypothetical protein HQ865_08960 [Mucilaginibacter mali]|uniref:Biotin-protein ligase N-terminal domain-containing protein n=1 Tax=Mucilaginibacter mali TaxID=2740462 RepID=A0A7D4UCX2_9SPHI|nr:BPL-N domain-containing protein [Mucilaginibacter mali]QKJ29879.1 hypothetical protein HQ865_08960 [Mucilaginibacter mali]